ncbi:hypothetical protein MWU38_11930 [Qipengyuania sp. S6317L1]|uniref:hypothetical protein n=1 Tax=Qipengyuania sp. S6317L1 TaxID=2926410 RepID=UPI001FF53F32|nr:hypothetical protein [Qipengyuania sp. S6317L1]MCK0100093.1 hypothetical protein [Qipengyuania sp. S6317L1]
MTKTIAFSALAGLIAATVVAFLALITGTAPSLPVMVGCVVGAVCGYVAVRSRSKGKRTQS